MAETATTFPPEQATKSPKAEKQKPASAEAADQKVEESLRGAFLGQLLDLDPPVAAPPNPASPSGAKTKPAAEPPPDGAALTPSPDTAKTAKPEKESANEDDEPAAPPPKKKTKVEISRAPQQPQVDVAQIASAAATAAIDAQRRMREEDDKKQLESSLPDSVKKYAAVYDELHSVNPSKYPKDLTQRMAKFRAIESKYVDEWERLHPDENYDAESEQHASWYAKNQPEIDPEDFADARVEVRLRDRVQREVAQKTEPLQRQVDMQRLQPEILAQAKSLGESILKEIVPDFKGAITAESMEKLNESDPIALEVASQVDNFFAGVVYEAGLLWNDATKLDERNPAHQAAKNIAAQFEEELAAADPRKLVRNGKKWVPYSEYSRLSPADRSRFYHIEYPDLVNYIRKHVAPSEAKQIYDSRSSEIKTLVEKQAGRFGYKKSDVPEMAHSNGSSNGSAAVVAASPVVTPGAPPAASGSPTGSGKSSPEEEFWKGIGLG